MRKFFIVVLPLCIGITMFINACKLDPDENNNPASSSQGVLAWTTLNGPLDAYGYVVDISQLVITASDKIYAVNAGSLYSSTDGGATWKTLNFPIMLPTEYPNPAYLSGQFVAAPNGTLYLQIATAYTDTLYQQGPSGYKLFRSQDNGATWDTVTNPLGTLVSDANSNLYSYAYPTGLYFSPDNGNTWSANLFTDTIENFSTGPNGYAYIGTASNGLLRSKDHGATWQAINAGLGTFPGPSFNVPFVSGISPDGEIYVNVVNLRSHGANGGYGAGFFRSGDNGATWQQINNGLSSGAEIENPLAFLKNKGIIANAGVPSLYSPKYFISSDIGTTWQTLDIGLSLNSLRFCVDSKQYLYAIDGASEILKSAQPVD
jgi:photosystem II stability/assembly factor-like uncharacterized protein